MYDDDAARWRENEISIVGLSKSIRLGTRYGLFFRKPVVVVVVSLSAIVQSCSVQSFRLVPI